MARKIRVFNSQFEFVEFELHGLFLSRNRVEIPSDLLGLAKSPETQELLRSSVRLIGAESGISSDCVTNLKKFIVNKYLTNLPGYGTVILRENKASFQESVKTLERCIVQFQEQLGKSLDAEIDKNRETLVRAFLPSVESSPPERWRKAVGSHPETLDLKTMLTNELRNIFGNVSSLFTGMKVKLIFKGITYELLSDTRFMKVAREKLPTFDRLWEEFDAAKAEPPEKSAGKLGTRVL